MDPFGAAVKRKARDYLADGFVHQDGADENVWWVQGTERRPYRVQIVLDGTEVVSRACSCRHGEAANGSAKCSHVLAALIRMKEARSS